MQISGQFNRFMHGVVLAQMRSLRYLCIREHRIAIRPFYLSAGTLKQLLKVLDFDYPREKDGAPLSYTQLSTADMLAHLAYIETLCAENGIEPEYLREFKEELRNGNIH